MGSHARPKPRLRWFAVPLTLTILAIALPCATLGWRDTGSIGIEWNRWTGEILRVRPGSTGAAAGLAAGDRIVSSSIGAADRVRLINPPEGRTFRFAVRRGDGVHPIVVEAAPARSPYEARHAFFIATEIIAYVAFLLLGTALFVMRPGWMTFSFYFFCIGFGPLDALVPFYTFAPSWLFVPGFVVARTLLSGFSALPLLPFAVRFPTDTTEGWRRRANALVVVFVAAGLVYYGALAIGLTRTFIPEYRLLEDLPALAVFVAAIALILANYTARPGAVRQRLKIAVAGMIVGVVAISLDYLPGLSPSFYPIANTVALAMPISIAYSILRHRVFDLEYFVNRAVIFGVTATALVFFVGAVEWTLSRYIEEQHLALSIGALVSIAMGATMVRAHAVVDRALDRAIFHARYRAEEYLGRIARALGEAQSRAVIDESLVREPVEELDLLSAAVFVSNGESSAYERTAAVGWTQDEATAFDADDLLVRCLRADPRALRLSDIHRQQPALVPADRAQPVVAVPVAIGHEVLAFVLYGAHSVGTDIDPKELAILEDLAAAAAVAYLRVRIRDDERTLASIRS